MMESCFETTKTSALCKIITILIEILQLSPLYYEIENYTHNHHK